MDHSFQLALVTGASSGIGEALCHLLASQSIHLIITGKDLVRLKCLAETLEKKVKVTLVPVDLACPEGLKALLKVIHEEVPDLIINNAGFGLYGNAADLPIQEQLKMLDVNARAPLEITLESISALRSNSKQGVILNVASAAAFQPGPLFSVYAASKAFLVLFSESTDLDLANTGIRVLVSCPGQVATSFQSRAAQKNVKRRSMITPMTSKYAANQLWKQIQQGQTVRIFDWKYRLACFLGLFIPRKITGKLVQSSINKLMN
jgi:hypothetical protein